MAETPATETTKNYVTLDEMTHLSIGKKTRLHRLLYKYGPGNGTLMVLPYDQGIEHGPRDFLPQPASADPAYILRLAKEGNFSAVAFELGPAEKYMREFAGEIPLILKASGKTEIPGIAPFSPLVASVEDAVRLGADAIGYTIYIGSGMQSDDFIQFARMREEAEQAGLPVMVWSYPRGEFMDAKGGADSFYATDYAARVAMELGADIVKLHLPKFRPEKASQYPAPYNDPNAVPTDTEGMLRAVVRSAGRTLTLLSGGTKDTEEQILETAHTAFRAGVTGLIFGRNVWQRPHDEALSLAKKFHAIAAEYGR